MRSKSRAAAPTETQSCRTQGDFCLSIFLSVRSFVRSVFLKPEKPDLRHERAHFRPEMPDFRPLRADFRPE